MLVGADAVGSLAVGQEPSPLTTTVLSASTGSYTYTGGPNTAFQVQENVAYANYPYVGFTTGAYAFGSQVVTGAYPYSGYDLTYQEQFVVAYANYSYSGNAVTFRPAISATYANYPYAGYDAQTGLVVLTALTGNYPYTGKDSIAFPFQSVGSGSRLYRKSAKKPVFPIWRQRPQPTQESIEVVARPESLPLELPPFAGLQQTVPQPPPQFSVPFANPMTIGANVTNAMNTSNKDMIDIMEITSLMNDENFQKILELS
jgi:hypothetical protein